ncbi:hypothetical protein LCGC14_0278520 [marine sediment metagenome]|uniref:Glycine zipper domain-containing protein n=1 Tax=marine sediment metagenome TaxID=412755 RepID=A0A0F9U1T9_9ZZZZ
MPDINIAHEGWKGAGAGAVSGAVAGSVFGPIGTGIGAGIGAIVGFFGGRGKAKSAYADLQASESAFAQARETALEPIPDPGFADFGRELRREKRMVETGMTPEFQTAKDLLERTSAQQAGVGMKYSSPAMAMSFMKQSGIQMGANINKLLGMTGSQRTQYNQQMMDVMGALYQKGATESQRKLDVDLWEAIQTKADYAQSGSTMMQNRNMMNMQALSELPGVAKNVMSMFGGGSTTPGAPKYG